MFIFYSAKDVSSGRRKLLSVSTSMSNMQVRQIATMGGGTYGYNSVPVPTPAVRPEGTDAWVYIPDEYGQFYVVPPDNEIVWETFTTQNTGYICRLPLIISNMEVMASNYTIGSYPLILEIGNNGVILYDQGDTSRCVKIGKCEPGEGVIKFFPNTGLWQHYDDDSGSAGTMDKVPMFSYGEYERRLTLVTSELNDPAWSIDRGAWTRESASKTPIRVWAYMDLGVHFNDNTPSNGNTDFGQTAYLTRKGLEYVKSAIHDIDDTNTPNAPYVVR